MTDIVTPIPIDALPPAPLPTDTPATFDSKSFALLGALAPMVTQTNAIASATQQNTIAAHEQALAAAEKSSDASGSAFIAQLAANSAQSTAGVSQWVSGAMYAAGDCV